VPTAIEAAMAAAIGISLILLVCHGLRYFFLLDDFALFGESRARPGCRASDLARQSVEQFDRFVDRDIALVHITNLPHRCIEGPAVLTNYSFTYFYEGRQTPRVAFDASMITCSGMPVTFLGPVPAPAASGAVASFSVPLEVTLTLRVQT
jgi:hypothetical protein